MPLDYSDLRSDLGLDTEQPTLSDTIKSTPDFSPEQHGQDLELGRKLNLPAEVVRDNRDQAKLDVQFVDTPEEDIKQSAGVLYKRLREDPDFAVLTKDDIAAMKSVTEQAGHWDKWVGRQGGMLQKQLGGTQTFGGIAGMITDIPLAGLAEITGESDAMKEHRSAAFAEMIQSGVRNVREGQKLLQENAANAEPGSLHELATDVADALPQFAVMLGMGMTMGPAGSAAAFIPNSLGTFGESIAEGEDPIGAWRDAGVNFATEYLPERIPLKIYLGPKGGKSLLKRGVEGTIAEGLTEGLTNILQSMWDAGTVDENATVGDAIAVLFNSEMWANTWRAMKAGGVLGAGGAVVTHPFDPEVKQEKANRIIQEGIQEAESAENTVEQLKQLGQKVQQTKLFGRNREILGEFIEEASDSKNIYVDSAGISEVYLQLGQEAGDQLLRDMGIDQQVEELNATNGDFVMPLRNFAKIMDNPSFEQLLPHMRKTAGEPTLNEVQTRQAEIQAEADNIITEIGEDSDTYASAERVRMSIQTDLEQTGMSPEDAAANALLHRNFALVASKWTGLSPEEAHGGVRVERAVQTEEDTPTDDGTVLTSTEAAEVAADLGLAQQTKLNDTISRLPASLREEIDYVNTGFEDGPDLADAFEDVLDRVESGDFEVNHRQRRALREAAIEMGIYRPISEEELARTDVVSPGGAAGKAYDFVHNKQKYVFNKHIKDVPAAADEEIEFDELELDEITLAQSASVRRGNETLKKWGLNPGQRYRTREVAIALEARQAAKYGRIGLKDHSTEAESKIARWMAEEVKFELEHPETSGVGWYSEKWQNAISKFAKIYPELGSDQDARNMFTLFMAITSDGQRVYNNFNLATRLYSEYRTDGRLDEGFNSGGKSNASMVGNIKLINRLLAEKSPAEIHTWLLEEHTVKDLNAMARAEGIKFSSGYLSDVKLPRAAVMLGPKLGAFYANLMGSHGYLTMDLWWTRTFNRYRGQMTERPTEQGIARYRKLLDEAGIDVAEYSDEDVLLTTITYARTYKAKNYKNGSEIERAANTLYKAAYENIRQAPENASDRSFMLAATRRAQKNLKRSGVDLSIADLQAILWYYEKRLYGELGARQTDDISYEEAAERVVNETAELNTETIEGPEGQIFELPGDAGLNLEVAPDPHDINLDSAFAELSYQNRLDATVEVANATVEKVVADMGLPEVSIEYTAGGYLDRVNPSMVIRSPGLSQDDLVDLGRVLGDIFSQDSVVVYDESNTNPETSVNHVRIAGSRELSGAEQQKVYDHLRTAVGGVEGFASRQGAMVIGDFTGIGETFLDDIKAALETLDLDVSLSLSQKSFTSSLEDINRGQGERAQIEEGRDVLRRRSGNPDAELDSYRRDAERILRQRLQTTYGQPVAAQPVDHPSISRDSQGVLRVDKEGMVPLTHWSQQEELSTISPEAAGTGVDALRRRSNQGRQRVTYWGLPGYRVESGVITLAKSRYFTRVKPESLYHISEDPDGIYDRLKAENPKAYQHQLQAMYEQAIEDAGYMGYWGQQGNNGPVAALFRPIEVDQPYHTHLKHKDKHSWVAGYDPEGNHLDDMVLGQPAWHGSASEFDSFSLEFLGTGEGAQAYGWGLYFAEEQEVANWYKEKLTEYGDEEGRLYRVDIDVLEDQMLMWDRPLAVQSEQVQRVVEEAQLGVYTHEGQTGAWTSLENMKAAARFGRWNLDKNKVKHVTPSTGRHVYEALKSRIGSDKDASLWLAERGILAIKYKDGMSRTRTDRWTIDDSALVGDQAASGELAAVLERANLENEGSVRSRRIDSVGKLRAFVRAKAPNLIDEFNTLVAADLIRSEDNAAYNYVVFDASKVSITDYEQSKDRLRGNIRFTRGGGQQAVIRLFEEADMSTFIHESGHFFLERMRTLADASPEAARELDKIVKWMGVSHPGDIGVYQHEMFARAFEGYLREGKAPIPELRSVFQRFREWLTNLYSDVKALDVDITEDIREVFDVLLTVDTVYAQSERDLATDPLFEDMEQAGMNEAEWKDYIEKVQTSREISRAKLDSEMVKDEMRKQSADFNRKVAAAREEITDQLVGNRTYTARKFLQTGEGFEYKPFKLNREQVIRDYGEDILLTLPRGKNSILADDGMDLDAAAELLGYGSGDQLIKDQAEYGDISREALKRARAQVEQEMGFTPKDQESVKAAAQEALMNRDRADVVYQELRTLDRLTGGVGIPRKMLKRQAQRLIGEMTIGELRPSQYLNASIRKARDAGRYLRAGDTANAAKAKRAQILNHLMYIQARDARNKSESQRRYFKKFLRPGVQKNIDNTYLDQIFNLLENFDFKVATRKEREKRKALAQFVAEKMAAGEEVLVPPGIIEQSGRRNFKDLTVNELRDLQDWVKNLEHLGRLKSKLIGAKTAREFQEAKNEIIASLRANNKWHDPVPDRRRDIANRTKRYVKQAYAHLLNMEFAFMKLDGDKRGVMFDTLFRPISEAQDVLAVRKMEVTQDLKEMNTRHGITARGLKKKTYIEEIDESLTKEEILSLALNWGNELNRQRVLSGGLAKDGSVWNEGQIESILAKLSKEEWNWVQETWDYINNEFWPDIADLEKELSGVPPDKVEPMEVNTPYGKLKGGYYPLKYDGDLSEVAYKYDEKASVQEMFGGNWARAATRRGHTEKRVENLERAIRLDLGVLDQHISEVLLDLTHRKPVMDAVKIINDPEIQQAIKATGGNEMYRLINPWLQWVSGSYKSKPAMSFADAFFRHLRIGTSVVGIGFRVSTALINFTGIFPAFAELRNPTLIPKHAAYVAKNPIKTWEFITERSEMMKTRSKVFDREASEQLKKPNVNIAIWYSLIAKVDQMVTMTTWMAAYEKGMADNMNDEAKAITYADSVVRTTQSSSRAADLSRIQRSDSELNKLVTVFYSYFNMVFNRLGLAGRKIAKGDVIGFTGDVLAVVILPAIIGELIAGRGPDEEDEDESTVGWAAKSVLSYTTGTIPILRDIAQPFISGFQAKPTPLAGFYDNVSHIAGKLNSEEGVEPADLRKPVVNVVGYLGHLPAGQVNKTLDYLLDEYPEGEESFNAWHALMGKPKE